MKNSFCIWFLANISLMVPICTPSRTWWTLTMDLYFHFCSGSTQFLRDISSNVFCVKPKDLSVRSANKTQFCFHLKKKLLCVHFVKVLFIDIVSKNFKTVAKSVLDVWGCVPKRLWSLILWLMIMKIQTNFYWKYVENLNFFKDRALKGKETPKWCFNITLQIWGFLKSIRGWE